MVAYCVSSDSLLREQKIYEGMKQEGGQMNEFRPCPFCGSKENIYVQIIKIKRSLKIWTECLDCGSRTGNYRTEGEAIDAWNGRADNE